MIFDVHQCCLAEHFWCDDTTKRDDKIQHDMMWRCDGMQQVEAEQWHSNQPNKLGAMRGNNASMRGKDMQEGKQWMIFDIIFM